MKRDHRLFDALLFWLCLATLPWAVDARNLQDSTKSSVHSAAPIFDNQRPEWSPDSRRIAFQSSRDGNFEIYVMNADGSNPTRLTNNTIGDFYPNWSPDGKKLAFSSHRNGDEYSTPGKMQIYVMNADGSHQTRITNNAHNDFAPAWSPDGREIAFVSDRSGINDIHIMKADGAEQVNLTLALPKKGERGNPHWSPDGTKIIFDANFETRYDIYVINVDGSHLTKVTTNFVDDFFPSYSPDGSKIAFASRDRDRGNWDVYVMNADGTGRIRLTTNVSRDFWQSWSPNGRQIVFTSNRDGEWHIYSMNADGSNQTRLTSRKANSSITDRQFTSPHSDLKIACLDGFLMLLNRSVLRKRVKYDLIGF
jgi:Tol biopolymer transport system component